MAGQLGRGERKPGYRTDNEQIVKDVRERLDQAWQYDRENREAGTSDLAFLAGDQWPEAIRREREIEGRPMLTVNRLPQFLRQVTNDIRQADLAIKVAPVDDRSDPELAKIYNGLLRQIQAASSAKHVYSAAAESQAGCGVGWFRILTQYCEDSAFEQEIKIKLIPHPFSVFCDPAAVEPDRSDAMWMMVAENIPTATFKERYPKAAVEGIDISTDNAESRLFWVTKDAVRIAEYWCKKPYMKTLGLTEDGRTVDITGMSKQQLAFMPPIVKTRQQQAYKVVQYLVSGSEVLEGPHEWAGRHIPIIPVLGAEVPLDQKVYRYGVIRFARDPQQLYNFYRTATAEMIALAPKSPYLVTTNMLSDPKIKALWDTANKKNRPYLPYIPDPQAPGGAPRREHPPEMPSALIQEAQVASEDMKATTGIYDAGLGRQGNETSGKAILARQHEGDVANYHFIDNLQRSLEYAGRILIDLIPKIYDTERVVRLMGDDDTEEFVKVNAEAMDVDGVPMIFNDLSSARFDIRVTIGKSYSTKRMESAESLMAFAQAIPGAAEVVSDLIAKNMDWPGAEEIAKRLKNTIPKQVLHDPEDPKAEPPPDPMEDPVVQLDMRIKAADAMKKEAEAMKLQLEAAQMQQMGVAPSVVQPTVTQPDPTAEAVALANARKAQADAEMAEIQVASARREMTSKTDALDLQKREMDPKTNGVADAIRAGIIEAMSMPREVVRGPDGKATGVRIMPPPQPLMQESLDAGQYPDNV
jgi:hypothetical protein